MPDNKEGRHAHYRISSLLNAMPDDEETRHAHYRLSTLLNPSPHEEASGQDPPTPTGLSAPPPSPATVSGWRLPPADAASARRDRWSATPEPAATARPVLGGGSVRLQLEGGDGATEAASPWRPPESPTVAARRHGQGNGTTEAASPWCPPESPTAAAHLHDERNGTTDAISPRLTPNSPVPDVWTDDSMDIDSDPWSLSSCGAGGGLVRSDGILQDDVFGPGQPASGSSPVRPRVLRGRRASLRTEESDRFVKQLQAQFDRGMERAKRSEPRTRPQEADQSMGA
ncbi:hypothetical protein CDD83_9284 [Cordyceps sp. RAO-2017]|nr:hypothetical protein CDD83_9284 [Cordyceps sp. RAO-2017]